MAGEIGTARRRVRVAVALVALTLACGAAACSRHPVVEPSPGADVRVTFLQPHGIAMSPDSVIVVSKMRGTLVAVRGDSVVLRLTRLTGIAHPTAWTGHEVTFARDRTTKIEQMSFDGSTAGTVALVGMSWLLIWLFREAHY